MIQSAAQNHLGTGATDYVTNTYNFPGELLTSKREHKASPSGTATTILTTNEYDHVGRLTATKKKVNSQPEIIQSRLRYNEIGQLIEKKLHSENGGAGFIDSIRYTYNERGWMTGAASPRFTFALDYNRDGAGTVVAGAQYNGNVARQRWGHGSTANSTFSYSYDSLNRLTNGSSTGTVMSEVLTYDDMGNITNLKRDGHATGISYTYTGNRLMSLSGALTGTYIYDANGNATKDRTGMTFSYNHLNLPKTATKSGTSVTYLYDALGTKLRKTATVGSTTTQRDYVGGIEYSKVGTGASSIEMIHTEEGYLQRNAGNNTYTYHYNLTDHLGNVRATLQRTGPTTGNVIQKHDYYPFGKAKAIVTSGINKYLYNGKELQGEIGGQYDYGARFYDAEIGRWNVVDPLAEAGFEMSPYSYAFNNPILFIDPDGMWPDLSDFWDKITNLFSGGSSTSTKLTLPNGNDSDKIDYSVDLEPVTVNMIGPKREPVSGFWENVDYHLLGGNVQDGYTYDKQGNSTGFALMTGMPPDFGLSKPVKILELSWKTLKTVRTGVSTNRLNHIFGKSEHVLESFVKKFGSQEKAYNAVQNAANQALKAGKLTPNAKGILPSGDMGNIINVSGMNIRLIGGRVENGQVILSSFSRKGL